MLSVTFEPRPIVAPNHRMTHASKKLLSKLPSLVLLVSCTATAQNSRRSNTWDVSAWFTAATGEENTNSFAEAQIWRGGVSVGREMTRNLGRGFARGTVEYGFSIVPLFVATRPRAIYGGGFEPVVLRWNFSQYSNLVRPYIELAGGGLATTSNLPAGNTSAFNFTARGGGGIYLSRKKRETWDLGFRWAHISNANLGVRNPEFNGLEICLGYHWFK